MGWWDEPVRYDEVEQAVRELVAGADDEQRHRFGGETIIRLTTSDAATDLNTLLPALSSR